MPDQSVTGGSIFIPYKLDKKLGKGNFANLNPSAKISVIIGVIFISLMIIYLSISAWTSNLTTQITEMSLTSLNFKLENEGWVSLNFAVLIPLVFTVFAAVVVMNYILTYKIRLMIFLACSIIPLTLTPFFGEYINDQNFTQEKISIIKNWASNADLTIKDYQEDFASSTDFKLIDTDGNEYNYHFADKNNGIFSVSKAE